MIKLLKKMIGLLILMVTLCAIIVIVFVQCLPAQYTDTYQYEINKKYELLQSMEGPRVIYIGGSSGVFGFDSAYFEKEIGIPTLNLSMHAGFGMQTAANMLYGNIHPGDYVIFSFEPHLLGVDSIDAATTVSAFDGHLAMYKNIPAMHWNTILKYIPTYSFRKFDRMIGNGPVDTTMYSVSAFDERGDMRHARWGNSLQNEKDVVNFSSAWLGDKQIKYLNKLAAHIVACGGTPIYVYAPVRKDATIWDQEYENQLKDILDFEVIGTVEESMYEDEYMYDTMYHMNSKGEYIRTRKIIGWFEEYLQAKGLSWQSRYDNHLEVDLTSSGNPEWYILGGFSGSEETGTWTISEEAQLGFAWNGQEDICIHINALIPFADYYNSIYVNDNYIGDYTSPDNEFVVPASMLTEYGWQVISIKNSDIKSPAEMDMGADTRKLGLHVINLTVDGIAR